MMRIIAIFVIFFDFKGCPFQTLILALRNSFNKLLQFSNGYTNKIRINQEQNLPEQEIESLLNNFPYPIIMFHWNESHLWAL